MEMTRRQFALSLAAATYAAFLLFEPRFPHSVFPAAWFPVESPGHTIRRQ